MVGALTGVILLSLVTNILTLSDISSTWIDAVDGAKSWLPWRSPG